MSTNTNTVMAGHVFKTFINVDYTSNTELNTNLRQSIDVIQGK